MAMRMPGSTDPSSLSRWEMLVSVAAAAKAIDTASTGPAAMDTEEAPEVVTVILRPHRDAVGVELRLEVDPAAFKIFRDQQLYNHEGEWYVLTPADLSTYHGCHVASTAVSHHEFRMWTEAQRFEGDYKTFPVAEKTRASIAKISGLLECLLILYNPTGPDFPIRLTEVNDNHEPIGKPPLLVAATALRQMVKPRRLATFAWKGRRYYPITLANGSRGALFCRHDSTTTPPPAPTKRRPYGPIAAFRYM